MKAGLTIGELASGLRLFPSLLWDHEAGGSNPLTPTIDVELEAPPVLIH